MHRLSGTVSAAALRGTVLLTGLFLSAPLSAQTPLTLAQAGERAASSGQPVHQGKDVVVRGVVSFQPVRFAEFTHLSLQDERGHGLVVEAQDFMFEKVTAGDHVEVRGIVAVRDGLPVIQPAELRTLGHSTPPAPLPRRVAQLQNAASTGIVAVVEGRVTALGEDPAGEYLLIDDQQELPYTVYLPRGGRMLGAGLSRFRVGDRIRAVGIATERIVPGLEAQGYRMVIPDAGAITLMDRDWVVSPHTVALSLLGSATFLLWLVYRRRRREELRRSVRRINNFCEELLTANVHEDVTRKLRAIAPRALGTDTVEFHKFDRGSQVLRRIAAPGQAEPVSVADSKAGDRSGQAISLCFRNRTPLHIPDTRRSRLFWGANRETTPRSVVLLPAFARDELTGVIEVAQQDRPRRFAVEELTALQHMANQVAMVLKLQEQQQRKEQMMRSERLAATGQILSGVAGELKQPLESILTMSHKLLDQGDVEARAILSESLRASAILARYSQVLGQEEVEAVPVEMNGVIERVLGGVRKEVGQLDLHLEVALSSEPLWIVGSAAQMEHTARNLLLLAARSAQMSPDHSLRVETALTLRRVVVSIRYGALLCDEYFPSTGPAEADGLGFSVCRGILHGFGGDLRILRAGENTCRMEMELPAAYPAEAETPAKAAASRSHRTLSAIILEPDPSSERRLISVWSSRGHRAVPMRSEAEAQELLRRVRMDVIFCAVRLGGGNWVDFFDAVRDNPATFVLLTDGFDSDAATLFPQQEGLVLRKPIEAGDMDRLVERLEQRSATLSVA